ncbi:MAG: Holliday junction resolvase RuvX [Lachnospiraceae bacterium]|nr:Holliday junction resolvase RuvX [Lachnospiraceae bacterium]
MEIMLMGLDYGSVTVGVALSDALLQSAWPREIIRRDRESKLRHTLARIEELARENAVTQIVVGLPLNMDGSEGERARAARAFAEKVRKRTGLPVELVDERLTTVEADEILDQMGLTDRAQRKAQVDAIAASLILQDYMDNNRNRLA